MKRIVQYLIFGLLLTAAVPSVHADELESSPMFKIVKVLMDLDLSDEQKTQAATIVTANRPELRSGFDAVKSAHEQLFETIHRDSYDEQAVRDAARNLAQAEEEFAVSRAKLVSQIRTILTAEQKTILASAREEARENINGKIAFVRSLIDRWLERHTG